MASLPQDPTYTVFIRVPLPRGDFVDPPPANWEPSKDDALWSIISKLSKTEIDWNEMHVEDQTTAAQFQVTVDFLLQQVAWLTERHASQVRAQMRKAATAAKVSPAPSPQPPPASAEGPFSTNTAIFTTRNLHGRSSVYTQRRRLNSLPVTTNADELQHRDDPEPDPEPDPLSPGPAESSSAASSDSSGPAQSRIIRRPPQFRAKNGPSYVDEDEDEDDDAELAFLPYRPPPAKAVGGQHDMGATLRGNLRDSGNRLSNTSGRDRTHRSQTLDSSTGSAPIRAHDMRPSGPSGPLSPRRTAELAGRSPAGKSNAYSRDSDGTPSMGSSFSDLDDASVTQSALEEAIASKMQDGGTIGSLRGTLSNAFRSRYQTKPGNPS